jgi:methyltransferase (TIGR00027 family)
MSGVRSSFWRPRSDRRSAPETEAVDATRASLTALATSLMRAIHTRLDRPALIDDPWADRLVSDDERESLSHAAVAGLDPADADRVAALQTPSERLDAALRLHPAYPTIIVRTRYAEEALAAATARGVLQYVIVGAGMDSFALRRPDFARGLEIFEVDLPATQEFKRRRLHARGVALPDCLHFVDADLSVEGLGSALARSSFSADELSFFSWLGVTSYLTRQANVATLREIASCSPPDSELVFTYIDQREFEPETASPETRRIRAGLEAAGEPWVSGFIPELLADELRAVGLTLLEDLGGDDLGARYWAGRGDQPAPARYLHIALARVVGLT